MSKQRALPKYTAYHLLTATTDQWPDSIAQKYRPDPGKNYVDVTYREMYENVRNIALGLTEIGMQRGDRVGLIADVGHLWMQTSLGITSVGGVDVPRGTDATEADLKYIFGHAECPIVILEHAKVFEKIRPSLGELGGIKKIIFMNDPGELNVSGLEVYTLKEVMAKGAAVADGEGKFKAAAEAVSEDDLVTIIYTSGTTGSPKGVMHTHKSQVWEVVHTIQGIKVDPNGVTMGFLPPWHVAERLIEMTALRTVTAVAFTSVPTLARDLAAAQPTFLLSVPRVWEAFYNRVIENVKKASPVARALFNFSRWTALKFSKQYDVLFGLKYRLQPEFIILTAAEKVAAIFWLLLLLLPYGFARIILGKVRVALGGRVKFAISGAGALPEHIDRFFYSIGVPIVETYGMTETMGVTARRRLPGLVVGTVGRPFPGTEIKLLDEQGNEVKGPYEKGVAWHRGPHIMKGYYKDPDKTSQTLVDGWLNSGDILMWTVQGDLKFAGRAKDTIVLFGGENVEPLPIEDALNQSSFIASCVVVGQDKKNLGVLIIPAVEPVQKHFEDQGVSVDADWTKWNDDEKVRALMKSEIKRLNSDKNGFKNFERVSAFYILPREFHIGDELTQTLKIKRNVVLYKYEKEIEAMYS